MQLSIHQKKNIRTLLHFTSMFVKQLHANSIWIAGIKPDRFLNRGFMNCESSTLLKHWQWVTEPWFFSWEKEHVFLFVCVMSHKSLKLNSHVLWKFQDNSNRNDLFVSWFGVFRPTREFYHAYGDVIIAIEGLLILTYARHSWPLSIEGSLACHTYCDTGHPFIMIICKDTWHAHLLPSVWQWRQFHYLFLK